MGNSSARVPAPRMPEAREITSPEPLLPVSRLIVKRKGYPFLQGLELKPGMKVLMIVDSTNDSLVQEAFRISIKEAGGKLETIMLHGYPELKEPVELVDTMFSRQWWPSWIWPAIREADIVMQGAMLMRAYAPDFPLDSRSKPLFITMGWTADILASNYETFPIEVRNAIDKKTWELLCYARKITWTDAEGTELRITLNKEDWEKQIEKDLKAGGVPYKPCHLMIPLPSRSMEGVLVTSSLSFGGPVPKTIMKVEEGQVTEVEGEGKFGDRMRTSFENSRELTYSGLHGPGINRVISMGIHTNPKALRCAHWDVFSGSGRVHAWAFGHMRSGLIHSAISQGMISKEHKVVRHIDQYFPTIVADEKKVIDCGRLVALDDPQIRKLAEKYDDPDKLLIEDWIPGISGLNIP